MLSYIFVLEVMVLVRIFSWGPVGVGREAEGKMLRIIGLCAVFM